MIKIKLFLQQAFLDKAAWPTIKTLISHLPEPERTQALSDAREKMRDLTRRYPEGTKYLVKEFNKMIPKREPLESFFIDPQLPSGEKKG